MLFMYARNYDAETGRYHSCTESEQKPKDYCKSEHFIQDKHANSCKSSKYGKDRTNLERLQLVLAFVATCPISKITSNQCTRNRRCCSAKDKCKLGVEWLCMQHSLHVLDCPKLESSGAEVHRTHDQHGTHVDWICYELDAV